jgi:hypothetical protein
MAEALRAAIERGAGSALSVEECVGLMVDREWTERENRSTSRRIKDAKLGMPARRQLHLPADDNYISPSLEA